MNNQKFRLIPKVDEILENKDIKTIKGNVPYDFLLSCIHETLDNIREEIKKDASELKIDTENVIKEILKKVNADIKPNLKKVINASGTVLHTNLGRSIMSKKAIDMLIEVSDNFSNLEYNIKNGERGSRHDHIEEILKKLTGCESCMVVNNNAAATILVLSTLSKGKKVIVSRGELIEIGGAFRIPEIMEESGAILKEVGTTNKTKISDYENAYEENLTGALLKVHTSNYKIVGFTEAAKISDLVDLSAKINVPLVYDMGNGLFVDLKQYGIDEPTINMILNEGIDVMLFSGDKLLGGPQAGIILGKKKYIDLMKKNPLARAFRVDKLTIASLYATLFEYFDIEKAKKNIPILKMITYAKEELKSRAEKLFNLIKNSNENLMLDIVEVKDQIGGGTAPNTFLDGYAISIVSNMMTSEDIEEKLRTKSKVPIIARTSKDRVLLDIRTIKDEEFDLINQIIKELK